MVHVPRQNMRWPTSHFFFDEDFLGTLPPGLRESDRNRLLAALDLLARAAALQGPVLAFVHRLLDLLRRLLPVLSGHGFSFHTHSQFIVLHPATPDERARLIRKNRNVSDSHSISRRTAEGYGDADRRELTSVRIAPRLTRSSESVIRSAPSSSSAGTVLVTATHLAPAALAAGRRWGHPRRRRNGPPAGPPARWRSGRSAGRASSS